MAIRTTEDRAFGQMQEHNAKGVLLCWPFVWVGGLCALLVASIVTACHFITGRDDIP